MIRNNPEGLQRLYAEHSSQDVKGETPNSGGRQGTSVPRTDEQVIEKALSERGGKFGRLWQGDTSDYSHDHSAADHAFIHKLWSYTQDEEQIRRIHAMSGLHRTEKSGRRADYLQRSINRARDNVSWFYEWSTEAVLHLGRNGHKKVSSLSSSYRGSDSDDTKRTPLRAVPFHEMGDPAEHREILAGLVPEKYPTVWYGDGGSAKSMLALSFGAAIAGEARTWLGRAVGTAPVLYADFELDEDEQNRRVRRIVKGAGLSRPPENLLYLPALGYGPAEALKVAYEECERHGAKLMILDSFGPALQGDSEAAKDIIGFFGRVMEPFRALGVAVLIIDHQARTQSGERYQNKSAFGSVYKTNLTRSVIQIEATERGEDYLALRLRHKKYNFGAVADPFGAKVTFGDSVAVEAQELGASDLAEEGTLNASDRVKLALQEGPAYAEEIEDATGLALGTVKNKLSDLRKAGVVEPTGKKKGQAEQVQLASSPSLLYRGSDSDDAGGNRPDRGKQPLSASLEPGQSATLSELREQLDNELSETQRRQIQKLVNEGFSEYGARVQVLASDHPLDCECEVCGV